MLDFLTPLWLGFIGACLGSFLNVVAYRMPRGMSVVWKPSHCPKCGHAIRPRDNVPVLGWVLLRGRCRDCGEPIAARYAIVEATLGAAFFVLAYVELLSGGANLARGPLTDAHSALKIVWNPNWLVIGAYAYHATLLCLLMAMALIDQDGQPIPRKITLVASAIVAYCSYRWWDLYLERSRAIRIDEFKAPVDALLGIAWGASPWLAAAAWFHTHSRRALAARLVRIGIALGTVGGFLGLQAVVRVAILWLLLLAAARLAPRLAPRWARPRIGNLWPLWLATFLQLVFSRQLATLVSW